MEQKLLTFLRTRQQLEEKFTSLATEFCSPEALANIQGCRNEPWWWTQVLRVTPVSPRVCVCQLSADQLTNSKSATANFKGQEVAVFSKNLLQKNTKIDSNTTAGDGCSYFIESRLTPPPPPQLSPPTKKPLVAFVVLWGQASQRGEAT